jgi:hypothetical protein
MPLYRADRRLGAATAADVDAAAFRSVACVPHFVGLDWLRSYFDPASGQMTCYYEAARPEDVWEHARMAQLPCDAVTEVREYLPDTYR